MPGCAHAYSCNMDAHLFTFTHQISTNSTTCLSQRVENFFLTDASFAFTKGNVNCEIFIKDQLVDVPFAASV